MEPKPMLSKVQEPIEAIPMNKEMGTFLSTLRELVIIHGIDLFNLFKKLKAEILIPIFLASFATLDYPHEDLEQAFSIIKKHAPLDSIQYLTQCGEVVQGRKTVDELLFETLGA
jgi:hypothetical protein